MTQNWCSLHVVFSPSLLVFPGEIFVVGVAEHYSVRVQCYFILTLTILSPSPLTSFISRSPDETLIYVWKLQKKLIRRLWLLTLSLSDDVSCGGQEEQRRTHYTTQCRPKKRNVNVMNWVDKIKRTKFHIFFGTTSVILMYIFSIRHIIRHDQNTANYIGIN